MPYSLRYYGGGEKWCISVCNLLAQKGIEVEVYALDFSPDNSFRLSQAQLNTKTNFNYWEIQHTGGKTTPLKMRKVPKVESDYIYLMGGYYHFLSQLVKLKTRKIERMLKMRAGDLSSCICVKRELLVDSVEYLTDISSVPDKFFLFKSLSGSFSISYTNETLSRYRIHESMSNTFLDPLKSLNQEARYLSDSNNDYMKILNLPDIAVSEKVICNILNLNKLIITLIGKNATRVGPIKLTLERLSYLNKYFLSKNNIILTLFSVLYLLAPSYTSVLYRKIRLGYHSRRLSNG